MYEVHFFRRNSSVPNVKKNLVSEHSRDLRDEAEKSITSTTARAISGAQEHSLAGEETVGEGNESAFFDFGILQKDAVPCFA